ncbi:MAG: 2-C-methyl-D-erythritol 4-phosphate cytidylyltransferase [Candidatus Heteroscillospira sp.]|jgi:2-C-methyl-D-erythritol 4-phosphate cytidylyltransferase
MKLSDIIRKKTRPFCSVVIVAAGSASRMGDDKLMLELCGVPVLARTLMTFDGCSCIDEIVVVTQSEKIVDVAHMCEKYAVKKVTKILTGGATRTQSALAGLSEIDEDARLAAVHDGARPLVTEEIISTAVHMAALNKAAAPAVKLKDTVKRVENGMVSATLPRDELVAVQTPQVFWPELIKGALTDAVQKGLEFTDDCAALEAMGVPVYITDGSYENIKITTPEDIPAAEAILRGRGL